MIVNRNALVDKQPIVGMQHRSFKAHGTSWGLSVAGYDITLAQTVKFARPTNTSSFHHSLDNSPPRYGRFCLASANELFHMPIDLVAIVHDKSTWARRGLSVFNTVIEPGWKGFLTLELVYHGQHELIIPAGSGIAQVMFHELTTPAVYHGKYQNQQAGPVEAITNV